MSHEQSQLNEMYLFLDQIQQIAQVGGWKLNPDTGELRWTDQVYRMTGLPIGTPIDVAYTDAAFVETAVEGLQEKVAQSWKDGKPFRIECRLKSVTGRLFWVDFRCVGRVQTDEGPFLFGTVQDIDARKKLELESLQWRQVFDQADFGLALSGVESELFIAVNPAYAAQRGYQQEELAGASIYTVYAPEAHDQLHELLLTEGGKDHVVYESLHIRKDGSRFPVRVEITAIKDADSKPVARISSTIDISVQREHAERTIRNIRCQKAQLKLYAHSFNSRSELLDSVLEEALTLAESTVGYLFSYDEDSQLLTLYGWSRSVTGQSELKYDQKVCTLASTGLWGEAIRQRRAVITNDYAAPNDWKKGFPERHIPIERHLNLPVMHNNRIVAVLGVANKATEYTEDDARQLQLFMEGGWHVLERLNAVEELRIAKELAEESSRVKTELLATMSHELRTPLNGVFGGSQLLAFTELTPEQHEYLEMIEVSASNELALINNLLELVKMEAEGINVASERFSVRAVVQELVKVYRIAACEKGLEFSLAINSVIPEQIMGDQVRLRQILCNLLGNAIKFTEQGGIMVSLEPGQAADGTRLLVIQVRDTGIGIADDDQSRIFELMTQVDMSETRKYGGLGLGLAICSRLAAAMGGRITVQSTLGIGSTFTLELPFQPVATKQTDFARHLSILLVEDDTLSALSGSSLLRKMGHAVTIAADGEQAVARWRENSYDLVLMDIHLPRMNGFDALHRFRTLEQELIRPRTVVVAQTAYVRSNYHESFIGAGFDGFVAKPLICEELEAIISRLCRSGNS